MKNGEYLLVRDVIIPSYPDGTNSVRRMQTARARIEWIDEELSWGGQAGEWRIVEMIEPKQGGDK